MLATMSIAAALAVAAVSLGWLSPPNGGPSTGPTFTYTPPAPSAKATATLAKLRTPAGLTRGACAQPPGNDDTLCFRTRQSIVPTSSAITGLIDGLGKTSTQQIPPCQAERQAGHPPSPRLVAIVCNGFLTLGSQDLSVGVTSVVWANGTTLTSTRASLPADPQIEGTEFVIIDYGSDTSTTGNH